MKLTKEEFKSMVKECLMEILHEGVGGSSTVPSKRPLPKSGLTETGSHRQKKPFNPSLDTPIASPNSLSRSTINETIRRESNGDPILASILADTAARTLPNMIMNENTKQPPPPAGSIESKVALSTPENLFGSEAASKWAALAFMENEKKF